MKPPSRQIIELKKGIDDLLDYISAHKFQAGKLELVDNKLKEVSISIENVKFDQIYFNGLTWRYYKSFSVNDEHKDMIKRMDTILIIESAVRNIIFGKIEI